MPGYIRERLDIGPAGARHDRVSVDPRVPGDDARRIQALEKQIAAQRCLSDLLEPDTAARAKSDAICQDMIETLDRLRSRLR